MRLARDQAKDYVGRFQVPFFIYDIVYRFTVKYNNIDFFTHVKSFTQKHFKYAYAISLSHSAT